MLLLVVVQAAVVRDEHCVGLLLLLLLLEVMVVRVRRLVMLGLMVVVLLMCRLWPGSLPTPSLLREHRRTFEGSLPVLRLVDLMIIRVFDLSYFLVPKVDLPLSLSGFP